VSKKKNKDQRSKIKEQRLKIKEQRSKISNIKHETQNAEHGTRNAEQKTLIMTINQIQDNIIEDFSQLDDWMDKYSLLIDLGNSLEPLDEKHKNPQNIIEGCQSRVWLNAEMHDGIITYQGESDAILVKGLVSLLIQVMSGHTPDEIINTELYFIDKIGLREHLSPTRSNGLLAMVKQMKMFALAYKSVVKD
jgi:cysteine desulfuration protein SufE